MKKGIIVLLITVLAAGMAFASTFTGSAAVNFTFNLDEGKGYGFGASNSSGISQYSFKFAVDSQDITKGEDHQTNVWAEIAASVYASIVSDVYNGTAPSIDWDYEITKANIHVGDLTIDILGPKSYFDYASSFTTTKYGSYTVPRYDFSQDVIENWPFGTKVNAGGVNLIYDDYTLAFAFNNKVTSEVEGKAAIYGGDVIFISNDEEIPAGYVEIQGITIDGISGKLLIKKTGAVDGSPSSDETVLYVGAQTKEYTLAEGLTLQAALNFGFTEEKEAAKYYDLGGSVAVGYEADKLTLSLATDGRYCILKGGTSGKAYAMDILASAKYDFIGADVYFGFSKIEGDDLEKALEAKVTADIPVNDDVKVSVTALAERMLYVDHNDKDSHFNGDWAGYSLSASSTIDKLTLGLGFGWNVGVHSTKGVADKYGMKISANAGYDFGVAKVNGTLAVNFVDNTDNKVAFYAVAPSVTVSSTTLVENCTLSLGWSSAYLMAEDFKTDTRKTNGSIVAGATISF